MNRERRLEKLERKAAPKTPALLFLIDDELRDVHNRLVAHAPAGAKVIVGIDPRDV